MSKWEKRLTDAKIAGRKMSMPIRKTLVIRTAIAWLVAITLLHGALNLHWFRTKRGYKHGSDSKFRVGFLPVTCHLTCPVTDFINKHMTGDGLFEPVRFNGWPELKEAYLCRLHPGDVHPGADGDGAARTGRADQDRLPWPPRRHGPDGAQGFAHLPDRGSAGQDGGGAQPLLQSAPAALQGAEASAA